MDSTNGTALQRLPPKKARPIGKEMTHHGPSFRCKMSSAHVAAGTSREHRLAHRPGSTVALEYLSQGHPVRGRNEACLQNSLGVSKARASRSRGIPTGEASSRWTLSNETSTLDYTSLALMRMPPGCSQPHRTGHAFSLGLPNKSSFRTMMLTPLGVHHTPSPKGGKSANEARGLPPRMNTPRQKGRS